ncbi:MAG: response regulator [Candidatus Acidiferrales bacterium]
MPSDGKLLLIVDDFEGVQYPYRYLLAQEGFRVEFATDGQDAVDKALTLQPDVIFMDVSLPVFDGWEATRRLRADERTKRIPVVMLTAFGLESARGHVVNAGFDGMLSKPCKPEEIHAEVDRILASRSPTTIHTRNPM